MTDLLATLRTALSQRYDVTRELGRGGMATVFLARDRKHERDVAIKVMHPDIAVGIGADRFLREIRIAAGLSHPHILPVHDSGAVDSVLYYVMPFAEGESLRLKLSREDTLSVDDALRIAREVADGLDYAHAHGVVHRDIKPENILLEGGHAVIADFGIARAASDAGADRLTATGTSIGTPTYMSPEQASGAGNVDARSDIYALGCMTFEMLTGSPPFVGSPHSVMRQHLTAAPPTLTNRTGLPGAAARAIAKALAKEPGERHETARAFRDALAVAPAHRARRMSRMLVSVAAVVVLGVLLTLSSPARDAWARWRTVPELRSLVDAGDWEGANQLVKVLSAEVQKDTVVAALRTTVADSVKFEGDTGVRVYRQPYGSDSDRWEFLGTVPATALIARLPFVSEFKFEKDGFDPSFDVSGAIPYVGYPSGTFRLSLSRAGTSPPGMVRVIGGQVGIDMARLDQDGVARVGDFYLDKYEVTNRDYQEFVDAGGYVNRDLWDPITDNGQRVPWEQAMRRFVDQTGRAGPATWEAGRFPRERDDHPVSGISWYEASAYARFRRKRLPTVFHWALAARLITAPAVLRRANMGQGRTGTMPVGASGAMNGFGTFDMAGNVREWCSNESVIGGGRYILGGGWSDPEHKFYEPATQSPFDRTASNGIRLMSPIGADSAAERVLELTTRDFRKERPVSPKEFESFRRMFAYDRKPLNERLERRDSTSRWSAERVSFDAAYEKERVTAYVFVPRTGRKPHQAVVFFPGSAALQVRSSNSLLSMDLIDYLVDDGRIVVYPVYKGTYEREDGTRRSDPDETNNYREHVVQWQRDVSRTLDYLSTRSDVDTSRFAYLGFSWGGRLGGVILSTEQRFKAATLVVAGLNFRRALPEAEDLNYMPHVHVPVMMINGRFDTTFPLAQSASVMFDLLGTSPDHKAHRIADGVHFVPRQVLVAETLKWFDRYLGPAK